MWKFGPCQEAAVYICLALVSVSLCGCGSSANNPPVVPANGTSTETSTSTKPGPTATTTTTTATTRTTSLGPDPPNPYCGVKPGPGPSPGPSPGPAPPGPAPAPGPAPGPAACAVGHCCKTCSTNRYCPANKGCYKAGQSGCSGGLCPAPAAEVAGAVLIEEDRPIGWPPTTETVGQGWCAVGVPPPEWHLGDYCGEEVSSSPPALRLGDGFALERFLSSSSSGSTFSPARIKVLTYNLFWWNLFGNEKGANGAAGKNIANDAKVEPFDLMGFQECEDVSWPLRDAKAAGMAEEYTIYEWKVKPFFIAIAYRTDVFDKLAEGMIEVADDGHGQYFGRRGAMWVRLSHKPTGKKVFFINHHGPTPINTGGACGAEGTAYNLLKVIADNAHVGDKVFFVGDFNYNWLNGRSWGKEIGLLSCHVDHIFGNPTQDDMWGLDNVFASCAKVVNKTVMPHGGSDHNALSAVFEI